MSAFKRNLVAAATALVGTALVCALSGPAASAEPVPDRPTAAHAASVGRLSLRLASEPGQVANVRGGGSENGTPVVQWPWTGGKNERWEATAVSDGYYRLASRESGKCLNVRGGGHENGAPVIQYTCDSGANEQWRFVPKGIGYQVVVRSSGKCLNVEGGVGKGNALIQYSCSAHGTANDVWLPVWEPVS
ncbi:RICIN domain-containing protein [Streptomyces celluloflavus]|uniref:RICIN domain-containing protein n=1 Tax=Streptomyces celluloflavus TaxID=58344 RepID=UPI00367F7D2C